MMHRSASIVVITILAAAGHTSAQNGDALVEQSVPKPRPTDGTLATTFYDPTESEKKLTKAWAEDELKSNSNDVESLQSFGGKRVSWFGIVREVSERKDKSATELLMEMKYFDGLTDTHLQIVSIAGAGDFWVVVPGVGHKIEKLSLARVYGKVEENPDAVPKLDASFVRVWKWGLFAFMDYGEDKSNPTWVKLRKVAPEDVYSSSPNKRYYEERLGER